MSNSIPGGGVESSPNGQYIRFDEKLGFGAYKDVWKSYDTETGREVAWNTVSLRKLPRSEQKRIESETSIMQKIKHPHIIKIFDRWENPGKEEICFTTEIVSSGTLKQYVQRIGKVKLKIIKKWCRQVLTALAYLHGLDPPVIHRDLKCDNIFINGATSDIRLGDFGLSAARDRTYAQSVLGTPEFMAPELYEESYTEKVDIYAFGMVVLEIATGEYPYSECRNAAQIWRRVSVDHIKPEVLQRIRNEDVRCFVELCLLPAKFRLSAEELLHHPFIALQDTYQDAEIVNVDSADEAEQPLVTVPEAVPASQAVTELDSESDNYGSDTADEKDLDKEKSSGVVSSVPSSSTTVTTKQALSVQNDAVDSTELEVEVVDSPLLPVSSGIDDPNVKIANLPTRPPQPLVTQSAPTGSIVEPTPVALRPDVVPIGEGPPHNNDIPFGSVLVDGIPDSVPIQQRTDSLLNGGDGMTTVAAVNGGGGVVPVSKIGILIKEVDGGQEDLVHMTVDIHFGTSRKKKRIKFNYRLLSDDPKRVALDMVLTLQLPNGATTGPLLCHAIATEVDAFKTRRVENIPHSNRITFFQIESNGHANGERADTPVASTIEGHATTVSTTTSNNTAGTASESTTKSEEDTTTTTTKDSQFVAPSDESDSGLMSESAEPRLEDAQSAVNSKPEVVPPVPIPSAETTPATTPATTTKKPSSSTGGDKATTTVVSPRTVTPRMLPTAKKATNVPTATPSNKSPSSVSGPVPGVVEKRGLDLPNGDASEQINYGEKLKSLTDAHIRDNREWDRKMKEKLQMVKELEDQLQEARDALNVMERERKDTDEAYHARRQILSEKAGAEAELARKRLEREEERKKSAKVREEQARQEEERLMESIESSLFPL